MKTISVVLPCFNEELNLPIIYERLVNVSAKLPGYQFEFIFIDNCSTDNSVTILEQLAVQDSRVKAIINMSNFGTIRSPVYALLQAKGDIVISMSSDLQDPPELIPQFLQKYNEGYHVVAGVKPTGEEKGIMRLVRRVYYKFMSKISLVKQIENFTGFGLYDQRVIEAVRKTGDNYPYLRGLIAELGFKVATISFHQPSRLHGESKHNFFILYDYAMLGITTQSKLPLRLLTLSGFVLAIISLLISLVFLVLKLVMWYRFPVGIAPILCGLFFFSSVQLFFIGLLGEYIMLIYTKIANRPLVIEERRINF